jgi:hypothetical protein
MYAWSYREKIYMYAWSYREKIYMYAWSYREKIYMYAWSYREKKLHQTSAFIPIHFLVAFIIFNVFLFSDFF